MLREQRAITHTQLETFIKEQIITNNQQIAGILPEILCLLEQKALKLAQDQVHTRIQIMNSQEDTLNKVLIVGYINIGDSIGRSVFAILKFFLGPYYLIGNKLIETRFKKYKQPRFVFYPTQNGFEKLIELFDSRKEILYYYQTQPNTFCTHAQEHDMSPKDFLLYVLQIPEIVLKPRFSTRTKWLKVIHTWCIVIGIGTHFVCLWWGVSCMFGKKFSSDVTEDGPPNPNLTETTYRNLNDLKEEYGLSLEQIARLSEIAIQEFKQELSEAEPKIDKWLQPIAGYSLSQLQDIILLLEQVIYLCIFQGCPRPPD